MGRPTKYDSTETPGKVYAIIAEMSKEGAVKQFASFCGIEQIADALDVHRDTVYEWMKNHDEFSDAIKTWETKRNSLFYQLMFSSQIKDARWIFLAKNWLGMTDRQEVDNKLSGEATINYVSHIPQSEPQPEPDKKADPPKQGEND